MITTVMFDLDGTLLPMDNDEFSRGYLKMLAAKLAPHGYDPAKLINDIWSGVAAMVKNDGSCTNEEAFWRHFTGIYGAERVEKDKPVFEEFYANDFKLAQRFCGYNAKAAEVVSLVKQLDLRVCLATNPLFPHIATETRIGWAGLNKEDFELVTTYENCHYCKPNAGYYSEILATIGEKPENCLMVGNDAHEDTVPESLGMQVYVLTDCLINRQNAPLTWPHGGFDELEEHIKSLAGRG